VRINRTINIKKEENEEDLTFQRVPSSVDKRKKKKEKRKKKKEKRKQI